MQEAVLLLALLYSKDFESNVYFQKSRVREWCVAGINFCRTIQHRDGSFDEAYPNEQSFVATSFLLAALAESAMVLEDKDLLASLSPILERSAAWVSRNENPQVANQMAGAGAALALVHKVTGREHFGRAAEQKIMALLRLQDQSGYFPEYGGWDIGYLTITISYLAKIHKMRLDVGLEERVERALNDAIKFVEDRVREDGSYDNTGSSRNTQYLYPSGFAAAGSPVIGKLTKGLRDGTVLNPAWMDDRFCVPISIDYLEAFLGEPRWC
jgi:hypothetical protein